jgi:diguanylate cyclase (GGDEF)-like protein
MLDITGRKNTDDQVAFRTYHDELTGLPSREMFEELVELSVARARRHEGAVAVLCVDLIDFRLVNDSLGHVAGDGLLVAVADRLREATRETDLVARRGGDQFLVARGPGPRRIRPRRRGASRRRSRSDQPGVRRAVHGRRDRGLHQRRCGDQPVPARRRHRRDLIRNAESAMFEAKRTGGAPACSPAAPRRILGRPAAVRRRACARPSSPAWTLYYQPVIDLQDGGMVGVEALIRWIEPDGTMIPPNDFIPLAEELGLIERIGDWVVRELDLPGRRMARARHRPRGRFNPVAAAVLAARPRAADPARVPFRRGRPVA